MPEQLAIVGYDHSGRVLYCKESGKKRAHSTLTFLIVVLAFEVSGHFKKMQARHQSL